MRRTTLVEVPLEADDIMSASELDWAHRDPQDRLIVATSLRLEYPLLTADRAIQEWGGADVVW
jgi:PIN domain nuclease of toxin-antitoxin system